MELERHSAICFPNKLDSSDLQLLTGTPKMVLSCLRLTLIIRLHRKMPVTCDHCFIFSELNAEASLPTALRTIQSSGTHTMTYRSRGRSIMEVIIAVTFVGFLTGFVLVLCIGNYYRAKKAMERQKQRRLAKLSGINGLESPRSQTSSNYSEQSSLLMRQQQQQQQQQQKHQTPSVGGSSYAGAQQINARRQKLMGDGDLEEDHYAKQVMSV
jgi:hypothetical protein